ncbi:reverse transcriptase domain, reverse transcriptase zinc-binding domain protein [Tanacetum coccineum]|uniref:Reverse transcriptase domain, reverse transcriptase zinc-binding domain protein n=1 Tax=Tanacetum coccineum TaxID=301880 RepID=A0ABQ5DPG0_9ASTR
MSQGRGKLDEPDAVIEWFVSTLTYLWAVLSFVTRSIIQTCITYYTHVTLRGEDDDYEGNGETGDSNGDNGDGGGDGNGTRIQREGYENQGEKDNEGSRVSSDIKIKDTFDDENDISYAKSADGSPKTCKDVRSTRVDSESISKTYEKDSLPEKDVEKVTKSKTENKISNNYVEVSSGSTNEKIMEAHFGVNVGKDICKAQVKNKIVKDNGLNTSQVVGLHEYMMKDQIFVFHGNTGGDEGEIKGQKEGRRGAKRLDSPLIMFGSGGVMFQTKRKMADDGDFEGNNYGILFSHGISDNKEGNLEQVGVTWAGLGSDDVQEVTNGAKENEGRDKIITLNVRGIRVEGKLRWIKSIIRDECPDVIGLQETKSGSIEESWMEEGWGNRNFRYCKLDSNDTSGGIILIWDVNIFVCKEAIRDERLAGLIERKSGAWCIFGDFNVVRRFDDRMNSQVNVKEMDEFNEFINVTRLIEIPMGGRKSTRVSDDGVNFNMDLDFGPKPLCFFDILLDEVDIDQVVVNAWNKMVRGSMADCRFRDKLKNMKIDLKAWSKNRFGAHNEKIEEYKQEALKWELEVEIKHLSDVEIDSWMEARRLWVEKDKEKSKRVKKVVESVVGEMQNAFIKGRFILDGILIANETVEYLRRNKKKGLIFKVDFEKAYDNINWAFLTMEGLNALVSKAVEKGIFKGVLVGDDRIEVSHLQYANDTIFFGEWSMENAKTLMCILKCFEEVSGLRVNYNKSRVYGIGVGSGDIEEMARWMKCSVGEFPFT